MQIFRNHYVFALILVVVLTGAPFEFIRAPFAVLVTKASEKPQPPELFRGWAYLDSISLGWNDLGEGNIVYGIYFSSCDNCEFSLLRNVNDGGAAIFDLVPGIRYRFYVTATVGGVESDPSKIVTLTMPTALAGLIIMPSCGDANNDDAWEVRWSAAGSQVKTVKVWVAKPDGQEVEFYRGDKLSGVLAWDGYMRGRHTFYIQAFDDDDHVLVTESRDDDSAGFFWPRFSSIVVPSAGSILTAGEDFVLGVLEGNYCRGPRTLSVNYSTDDGLSWRMIEQYDLVGGTHGKNASVTWRVPPMPSKRVKIKFESAIQGTARISEYVSDTFEISGLVSSGGFVTPSLPATIGARPTEINPSEQRNIIRSTVKLRCPVSGSGVYDGSGTVVSSDGFILSNKHVVEGTLGCFVGFIQDYGDAPDFKGGTVIADIYRAFGNQDVALLKIRDAAKNQYEYVNLAQGNGQPVRLGDRLLTFGYPAAFGETLTFTSGDHSGMYGQFIKTSAILDPGSSGGGAYISNGTYVGITTGGVLGVANNLGLILPMDVVGPLIDPYVNVGSSAAPGQQNKQGDLMSALKGKDVSSFRAVDPDAKRSRLITKDVLIRGAGTSTVYYFANDGKRYVFTDERSFKSWFRGFSEVIEVPLADLADMPIGGVVRYRPGARMVKITSDPKVYAVDGSGKLRWITSEQVAAALYGADWNKKIDDVDVSLFSNYDIGDPIGSASQFDPTAASGDATTINAEMGLPVLETTTVAGSA